MGEGGLIITMGKKVFGGLRPPNTFFPIVIIRPPSPKGVPGDPAHGVVGSQSDNIETTFDKGRRRRKIFDF